MKTLARTCVLFTGLMTLATSAMAAGSATQGSGLLVWFFLGFCGLILATQLVPALMLMIGIVRGIATTSEALPQTSK